jgi:hypothetical protein
MSGAQGIDLFDGEHGVLVSLRPGRSAVAFADGDLVEATAAAEGLHGDGRLQVDELGLDVALTPLADPLVLQGQAIGTEELTLVRAEGRLEAAAVDSEVAAVGLSTRVAEPPGEGLRRSVAVVFADGGVLALASGAPAPDAPHDAEETAAILTEPEGQVPIGRALLSTEYDAEGRQRRATVELWAGDEQAEPPIRGAGTAIRFATVRIGDRRVDTAFFSWSLEGRPGLGRYELIRPA